MVVFKKEVTPICWTNIGRKMVFVGVRIWFSASIVLVRKWTINVARKKAKLYITYTGKNGCEYQIKGTIPLGWWRNVLHRTYCEGVDEIKQAVNDVQGIRLHSTFTENLINSRHHWFISLRNTARPVRRQSFDGAEPIIDCSDETASGFHFVPNLQKGLKSIHYNSRNYEL